MAFYLAQASGTLNSAFPWSVNSVLSSNASESAVATAFSNAFIAFWTQSVMTTYLSTTTVLTACSVSTASADFKQTTKTTIDASHAGTATGAALPFGVAEIVTFRSAYATKWGRGRWYLPPLATNALALSGFSIISAAQTALLDGMNAYFTAAGTAYSHVILHKKATAGGARAAFTTDPVVAADIPNTFAVQKRRGDKMISARESITL